MQAFLQAEKSLHRTHRDLTPLSDVREARVGLGMDREYWNTTFDTDFGIGTRIWNPRSRDVGIIYSQCLPETSRLCDLAVSVLTGKTASLPAPKQTSCSPALCLSELPKYPGPHAFLPLNGRLVPEIVRPRKPLLPGDMFFRVTGGSIAIDST